MEVAGKAVNRVVDLGANVGYSSVYFLNRFPNCRVLAVEPDPDNCRILRANVAAYGDRVTIVEGAVWHATEKVELIADQGDGREWSRQVGAPAGGTNHLTQGYRYGEILEFAGWEEKEVDILKIDIEGAEVPLLRSNPTLVASARAVAVELHLNTSFGDPRPLFDSTFAGFERDTSGELTIAWRNAGSSAVRNISANR